MATLASILGTPILCSDLKNVKCLAFMSHSIFQLDFAQTRSNPVRTLVDIGISVTPVLQVLLRRNKSTQIQRQ